MTLSVLFGCKDYGLKSGKPSCRRNKGVWISHLLRKLPCEAPWSSAPCCCVSKQQSPCTLLQPAEYDLKHSFFLSSAWRWLQCQSVQPVLCHMSYLKMIFLSKQRQRWRGGSLWAHWSSNLLSHSLWGAAILSSCSFMRLLTHKQL